MLRRCTSLFARQGGGPRALTSTAAVRLSHRDVSFASLHRSPSAVGAPVAGSRWTSALHTSRRLYSRSRWYLSPFPGDPPSRKPDSREGQGKQEPTSTTVPTPTPTDGQLRPEMAGTFVKPNLKAQTAIHRANAGERETGGGIEDDGDTRTAKPTSTAGEAVKLTAAPPSSPTPNASMSVRRDGVVISENVSDIPVMRVMTKVLSYLWPKGEVKIKLLVSSSVCCVLLAKVLKIAVPFWFKTVVDLLAPSATAASVAANVGPFTVGVFGCVVAYGICRVTTSIAEEMKTFLFAPVGGHASTVLAMDMFTKLHKLDLTFHLNRETGVLSKDLDRGSRAFWSLAYTLLFLVIPTFFELALVCTALQTQAGPQFIGIALVAVTSYIAWTFWITNWRSKFRTRYNALDSRVGGLIVDSLLNYETVKYFGAEKYESERIYSVTKQMNDELVKLDQTMALLNFGQQLIFVVAGVLSLYLATCGVITGAMTVGNLVLIDALLMQLYMPLSYLGMIYREVQTSTQNMQAMIALMDQESKIVEVPEAAPYKYVNGTIELRNVSFVYKKDYDRVVLKNLSLTVPGGSTVAFVGPSGSGKTTIFRLLFRFFDPTDGEILYDGQPLSKLSMESVRKYIGVIPQDTVLFNESVTYNIRYGRMDATDAEVIEASKRASLDETVRRMSEGYDTCVGERGLKLSGGEKQRVAIARVLLDDPPILLADEATSALDSTTELNVMATLKEATQRDDPRTIILIAHRLTTVKEADIIFVLDGKGGLAEQGTHYELLMKNGLYAEMWFQQLRDRHREEEKERQAQREKAKAAATP